MTITIDHPDQRAARDAAAQAFDTIARLESALSDYRTDNDLARLAQHAGGDPIEVDPVLVTLLNHALTLARASEGRFDPTVGPATRLWRNARRTGIPPTQEQIADARARIGYQHVEVVGSRVRLARPGMSLDFGGIAKGFAAVVARDQLRNQGFPRSLVALDGDIAAGDPPIGTSAWRIAVGPDAGVIVPMVRESISTSGHVQIAPDQGGSASHLIDPAQGRGVNPSAQPTVTVRSIEGWLADGVATALAVTPRSEWSAMLDHPLLASDPGVEVILSRDPPPTGSRGHALDPKPTH